MKGLSKNTLLQRVYDLDIKIRSNIDIEIFLNGKIHKGNQYTLAILNAFSTPKSFSEGLEDTKHLVKGIQSWVELSWHIKKLFELGVLIDTKYSLPKILSDNGRFDAAEVHIRMLNDFHRTKSFQEAILKTVKKGDIVLEIGMGTGILSATAALAGAKHVYAIERTHNMPKFARKFFEKNGVLEKITILEGDSINIDLPEKADVLISEIIGNDPLGEDILRTFQDAVRRFLKPKAKLIPETLKIFGLPVSIPSELIDKYIFEPETILRWEKLYNLNFSSFVDFSQNQNHSAFFNTYETRYWPFLTEPILLFEIDLNNCIDDEITSKIKTIAIKEGVLNGIIVFFDLGLADGVYFSIHPEKATAANSWYSKVWIPGKSLDLLSGDVIEINYSYTGGKGSQFELKKV
ncbi:methyltransferase domain-containing protein [Cyclobacteriaceae bacterium YHN15]|nr:methyltransferase domain-containing protein [Cyclobacteriaceae bacterium YHN15]